MADIGLTMLAMMLLGRAETGIASTYGRPRGATSSGERLTKAECTAAHRILPFGSLVSVTNKKNQRSIIVRINDRGPFKGGRIIDIVPWCGTFLGMNDNLISVSVVVIWTPPNE